MKKIKGEFVNLDGKMFYKIQNYSEMEPFLMMLSTSSDIWVHLSSNGCICAGRESVYKSLFPYISEDKMFHSFDTGAKTLVKLRVSGESYLWQPFLNTYINSYKIIRNIYKSILGNCVIFEEINTDLRVCFRYRWETCEKYGVVRTACIENLNNEDIEVDILDGIFNILPFGVHPTVQANWSCLIDGYKKTELVKDVQAAIFTLTTQMNDIPTPEEMLKANIVWSIAPDDTRIFIDENTMNHFVKNEELNCVNTYCGDRGAYILNFQKRIEPDRKIDWKIIADVEYDQIKTQELIKCIKETSIDILNHLEKSGEELKNIIARCDGLQCTGDMMSSAHHMSNVTFNVMRGGLFLNNYNFEYNDFVNFIKIRNRCILEKYQKFFEDVKDIHSIIDLKEKAKKNSNPDLIRLCYEYLPISFSRRHGDPSRPWNNFSVIIKDKDGKPITNYEGNWRDIFQNWEAMCLSFPEYIESVVAKFLNATSADGFNSYRITKEGIDWERIDPNDPLSSLGYWGDHQIIYFSRLLEWLYKFFPEKLDDFIKNDIFSYANIPYEIADFDSMIKDPNHTVTHIIEKDNRICDDVSKYGTDFKLIVKDGEIYNASFAEKLIVPILSKISNLVPDGGIWMNTQRPEWNDANNAIVGFGLSVVTVCHLKRHLSLCIRILKKYEGLDCEITKEVQDWLESVLIILKKYEINIDNNNFNSKSRMKFVSEMGFAFDEYKHKIYDEGFTYKEKTRYSKINEFLRLCEKYIDSTIKENKREDGLFHSYNVMRVNDNGIKVKHLKLMLEGQVAVLGCEYLNDIDACKVLDEMERSSIYSQMDDSYYLYPIIHTKSFLDKNIINYNFEGKSELIERLLKDKNDFLVEKDCYGNIRFNSNVNSSTALKQVLENLSCEYPALVKKEYDLIFDIFEDTFNHSEFMGRSQVLYKYEGIGCIYWHQNSKLLVSASERLLASDDVIKSELLKRYRNIRNGLGFNKEPGVWGAFPVDAYSHTSFGGCAKQPGMTGQVKEEIITRFTELGVIINDGKIKFDCTFVDKSEFLQKCSEFEFIRSDNSKQVVILDKNSLAFTFCQTPIVYVKNGGHSIIVEFKNGIKQELAGNILPKSLSQSIFLRENEISIITVNMK